MLHYNFPPLLDGRDQADARPRPSRDRPRRPRRARRSLRMIPEQRQVPLHDPHRLRDARVERLVVDGRGLRRLRSRSWTPAFRSRRPVAGIAMGLITDGDARTPSSPTSSATKTTSATWTSRSAAPSAASPPSRWTSRSPASRATILTQALEQAREGRLHILGKMLETLADAAHRALEVRAAHHDDQGQAGPDPPHHRPRRQDHQGHRRPDRRRHRRRGRRHGQRRVGRLRTP